MVVSSLPVAQFAPPLQITWQKFPDDIPLQEEPVDNTGQPLLAGALREALELAGYLRPEMLVASNFGLCATLNQQMVIKAPDWVFIPNVPPQAGDRRSYTPHLEGSTPALVMEFLSETEGTEYSVKRTYPPGKWFFYEQVLGIPLYVLFEPTTGHLEVHQLEAGRYQPLDKDSQHRFWLEPMGLFLGVWQGEKEGRVGYWLRWWDASGELLPWGVEKVEQERQRAEQERQRADKLAAYLRSQGLDPDQLP
ncbi:MAG: Uma2 family endonuclease [Cyanobacteriota bacterium]|nr:Uma2 family endonuclease [Cyanobacteriota bacterium]